MVLNRQKKVPVELAPLQTFLKKMRTVARIANREVTVCLVSDAEMARMNRTYRGKQGPTDVLSFPATRRKQGAKSRELRLLGDIAIAPQTALRYARRHGRTLRDELRVLILHGVLHLMGYDHETDHGEMDRMEQRLRQRLGLPQ
jgi:probable rRNA maturation factor